VSAPDRRRGCASVGRGNGSPAGAAIAARSSRDSWSPCRVELIIRPAQPPDVEAIAGVHVRSWQIGHQADYPKHVVESVSVGERSQVWQKALRDPSAEKTVLIAEIDGVVVGFISSGPVRGAIDDAARTGEVYELFVDPASFGRGVGTALMERTLDRASRSSNARSIRFRRSHVPGVGWPVLTGPRSEPPLSREGPHPAWHRTPWPRRLD
jgi:GNAT superfamily N-acetyltransferase